jgi:Fur family ferric uptake transcriptional regulator
MVTQASRKGHIPWEISQESDELRRAGLKVTLPRLKILRMLAGRDREHLAAEEVYQRLHAEGEDIGLATVYRVLTQFAEAGIVIRHHFDGDRAVFELNTGIQHDHLVCVECGRVEEFKDRVIQQRQADVAAVAGYELMSHSLILYGCCPDCAQNHKQRDRLF